MNRHERRAAEARARHGVEIPAPPKSEERAVQPTAVMTASIAKESENAPCIPEPAKSEDQISAEDTIIQAENSLRFFKSLLKARREFKNAFSVLDEALYDLIDIVGMAHDLEVDHCDARAEMNWSLLSRRSHDLLHELQRARREMRAALEDTRAAEVFEKGAA